MRDVLLNDKPIITVNLGMIEELKSLAKASPRKRSRLCMHHSLQDGTQEMLIVLHRDTLLSPHRHPAGKSESYHVIEGAMRVFFFEEDGTVHDRVDLGPQESGRPFLYRLSTRMYHLPIVESEWVVYHEVFTGPFDKDRDVEYASWAPPESDPDALSAFYRSLIAE